MPRGRKKKVQEVIPEPKSTLPEAPFGRGQVVKVYGYEPEEDYHGKVSYAKWSGQSGWWLDIVNENDNLTYSVPADWVELLDSPVVV